MSIDTQHMMHECHVQKAQTMILLHVQEIYMCIYKNICICIYAHAHAKDASMLMHAKQAAPDYFDI